MAARGDRPRDDVARRELVGEPLAVVVDEQRALAAQRLREQEAVVDQGGRVELHELEVGERCAGAVGEGEPLAERAGRVRRPLPERGVAAGREQRRRGGDRPARGDHARAAPVRLEQAEHRRTLDDRDPRVGPNAVGERLGDRLARLGAAGVDDPAPRVAALAAEALVELDAERDEVGDARGRLLGQHPRRRSPGSARARRAACRPRAAPACRPLRAPPRRRPAPASCSSRRAAPSRAARRRRRRRPSARREPGDAAADDDQVEPITLVEGVHGQVFSS